MKRNIVRTILFATLSLSLALTAPAKQHRTCSTASVAGDWGYTETGTVIPPSGAVAAAAVGRATFDGAGNFSAAQYSSTGGNVNPDKKTGTITVSSDCTGTLTLSVYNQSGNLLRSSVWAVVLVDHGNEFRGIMTSLMLHDGTPIPPVMTVSARRLFPDREE